ncbi:Phosphonoacetaldehyde hydrolase [Stieleria bergensis]|uniref:Phosphonoacetaldehyde hydrolase n=1 Tax=Stieleria bergensis TaxID=2528025 RepID=A0A517SYF3_9BACT|nr:Phosphonoacetaldehyde hydrolase [Planctomycetes bacterium SV_7m_r]
MIELLVLDIAGTTVDEDNVVYKTVRAAINAAGHQFSQQQVQAAGAGKEKSQAIRDVMALGGNVPADEEVATIFADFKLRLAAAYESLDVREQPGASEVFAKLRQQGVKVVLNTGYDRATAEQLIAKIGWVVGQDIDGLVTASDVGNGRPAPDMIHLAMQQTSIASGENVAKIGDSAIDIEEGKNAGCGMTLGVTTGAQTREQLTAAGPTHIVDSLAEMCDLILPTE